MFLEAPLNNKDGIACAKLSHTATSVPVFIAYKETTLFKGDLDITDIAKNIIIPPRIDK